MLEEFDCAWKQFVEEIVKIRKKYGVLFKPANHDIFLDPLCYKLEAVTEVMTNEKRVHREYILRFDPEKVKHDVASIVESILDKKGKAKIEKVISKDGKVISRIKFIRSG